MKNKIIIICGPTAVGKTVLSIDLAQHYDGEVINGDSQQVYREVHIGTAKATAVEQATVPHHLIDVRDLSESFSAHEFVAEANAAITDILDRGKLPVIVGGTGLYLQSLIEGYHLGGTGHHEEMRALRAELEQLTEKELNDKVAAQGIRISEMNRRRATRALEIATFGEALVNEKPDYEVLIIGLNTDRQVLYDRINHRVDLMMTAGLLAEAKMLYDQYPTAQVSRAIGYKEFFPYFEGQVTLDQAITSVKQNSRRYSKRQLTWFKNRMNVAFVDILASDFQAQINQKVESFLNDNN